MCNHNNTFSLYSTFLDTPRCFTVYINTLIDSRWLHIAHEYLNNQLKWQLVRACLKNGRVFESELWHIEKVALLLGLRCECVACFGPLNSTYYALAALRNSAPSARLLSKSFKFRAWLVRLMENWAALSCSKEQCSHCLACHSSISPNVHRYRLLINASELFWDWKFKGFNFALFFCGVRINLAKC